MSKSQFAAEALIIYGFAILVVVVALFSFSYFGVFSSSGVIPNTCIFPPGFDCLGLPSISKNEINLALRNNQGSKIEINNLNITGCVSPEIQLSVNKDNSSYVSLPVVVPKDKLVKVKIICDLSKIKRFVGSISIGYTNLASGLSNSAVGEVKGNVI